MWYACFSFLTNGICTIYSHSDFTGVMLPLPSLLDWWFYLIRSLGTDCNDYVVLWILCCGTIYGKSDAPHCFCSALLYDTSATSERAVPTTPCLWWGRAQIEKPLWHCWGIGQPLVDGGGATGGRMWLRARLVMSLHNLLRGTLVYYPGAHTYVLMWVREGKWTKPSAFGSLVYVLAISSMW